MTGGRLWAVVVLLLALLVTGCRMRVDLELAVATDGAGTLEMTLGADRELLDRARRAGVDPLDELVAATDDVEGWTVSDQDPPAGGRSVTMSTSFDSAAELRRLTSRLAESLNAPELRVLEPFSVRLDPDRVTVEGAAALEPGRQVADLGLSPRQAVRLLEEAVSYRVAVTMPGDVLASTAASAEGRTLVWQVPAGGSVLLRATSERPSTPWLLIGGAAAGVTLVLLAAVRFRRNRVAVSHH